VSDPGEKTKERDREIAQNESARQTVSAIRVSGWAIAVAVVIGLAAGRLGADSQPIAREPINSARPVGSA